MFQNFPFNKKDKESISSSEFFIHYSKVREIYLMLLFIGSDAINLQIIFQTKGHKSLLLTNKHRSDDIKKNIPSIGRTIRKCHLLYLNNISLKWDIVFK